MNERELIDVVHSKPAVPVSANLHHVRCSRTIPWCSKAVVRLSVLAADVVVIGAPMYKFTLPTQCKAWVDRILIPGRTFRYRSAGPEGLMGGKRVIVAAAAGGFYGARTPQALPEHVRSYLGAVFAAIGITPQFIVAEGVHTEASSAKWRSTTPIAPSVHFNRHERTMPGKFPNPRSDISTLSCDAA
jgi:hypothetical protein